MLYMTGESGGTIIVLETGNLERLRAGLPLHTPDDKIVICWTPDAKWLANRIRASGGDIQKVFTAIEESTQRPEKPIPGPFPTTIHKFPK